MRTWPRLTEVYFPAAAVKPSLRPITSTAAATSTPGARNTKIGVPGLESYSDVRYTCCQKWPRCADAFPKRPINFSGMNTEHTMLCIRLSCLRSSTDAELYLVRALQIEGLRSHELRSEHAAHEARHGRHQTVRAEHPHNQHLVEVRHALPVACKHAVYCKLYVDDLYHTIASTGQSCIGNRLSMPQISMVTWKRLILRSLKLQPLDPPFGSADKVVWQAAVLLDVLHSERLCQARDGTRPRVRDMSDSRACRLLSGSSLQIKWFARSAG